MSGRRGFLKLLIYQASVLSPLASCLRSVSLGWSQVATLAHIPRRGIEAQ